MDTNTQAKSVIPTRTAIIYAANTRSEEEFRLELRPRRSSGQERAKSKAGTTPVKDESLTYVQQHFFSFHEDAFERFSDFYQEKYGTGAAKYLLKTYPLWRSGKTGMSGQTAHRILLCVPRFLKPEEQFELLSFQIPKIVKQITSEWRRREMDVAQLKTSYEEFARQVLGRTYSLEWFVGESFSRDEQEELLLALKYTILDCLRRSYSRICSDLEVFEGLARRIWGIRSAQYDVAIFNCRLVLNSSVLPRLPTLDIRVPEPRFMSQFQLKYREILVDHALTQLRQEYIGHANQKFMLSDAGTICSNLDVSLSNQELDLKLNMDGKGGLLSLHIVRRDIERLRSELSLEKLKLCVSVGLLVVACIYIRDPEYWSILVSVFWIPLVFFGIMLSKISSLGKEILDGERERRTWFTEA